MINETSKNTEKCTCIKKFINRISLWYLSKKECKENLTEKELWENELYGEGIERFIGCIERKKQKRKLTKEEIIENIKKIKKWWYKIIKELDLNKENWRKLNFVAVWLNGKYGIIDIESEDISTELKEKVIFDELIQGQSAFSYILEIKQTEKWLYYVAKKDWKQWVLKFWEENKRKDKIIFDAVDDLTNIKKWLYYMAIKDWKRWVLKYWKENRLKKQIIFDAIWELPEIKKWLYYMAKKDWKQWILKYWKEYRLNLWILKYGKRWKNKIFFDQVWKVTETKKWQYYMAKKDWKQWVLKFWKENKWKDKIIFDDVFSVWQYFATLDVIKYDKIKTIQCYYELWYYIAEKNWKQWILKCWEENKWKEKIIFDKVFSDWIYMDNFKFIITDDNGQEKGDINKRKNFENQINQWFYYIAEKNWKQWILKYWEENERKKEIIFDKIKNPFS